MSPATNTRRWWVIGAVVVVLVVAIAIAAASGGDSSSSGSSAPNAKQETASVKVEGTPLPAFTQTKNDPAIGDTAPTLVGEGFEKQPVTIAPSGKPQVVLFVAHWCPHCQAEVPRIVALAKSGAFDGIDVSTVATGTSEQAPNYPPSAWLAGVKWPFTVMLDDTKGTAGQAYGLPSYPYFVFLDGDGKVLARATGEIAPSDLQGILDDLRAGKALVPASSGASSPAS
ncbi:MAG TPA: TlpA disulfide reductase family protein [Acidimicrobiia bacterium]|nr:TlpA disulfide reductase family protein [Acidimicrobiia bacterium]